MNRRFYAPDGEGCDGHYMEIGRYPDKVGGGWFVGFYDADGNMYNVADGYEDETDATWYATNRLRPKWRDPWMHEPGICPVCGSNDCDIHHMTPDGMALNIWCECCECGTVFTEKYMLEMKTIGR